jgi:pimeloyl-ACP methyl ester carboxylesterase
MVCGMLAQVTDRLDDRFECRWVRYPACYGPVPRRGGISYRESVAAGVDNLRAELRRTSGPVMLIGYSQGAVVIRHMLATTPADIAAVGFIADPHQPPGVAPGCDGFGLAGPGPCLPADLPALWIGHPDDVICNASVDSLLRDLADLTATLSMRDVRGWLTGLWHVLRSNGFQNAARTSLRPRQWRKDLHRLRVFATELAGYLPTTVRVGKLVIDNRRGGRHTAYGFESLDGSGLTGCEMLGRWLQVQATFLPDTVREDVA